MNFFSSKRVMTSGLLIAILLLPIGASAGVGNILSLLTSITGTLKNGIGQALTGIQAINTNIRQFEQQFIWPVSLINETRASVAELQTQFSNVAAEIHSIRGISATLQAPSRLETLLQSNRVQELTDLNSRYVAVFLSVPEGNRATESQRNLIDIDDASTLESLKTAVVSDQAAEQMLQLADGLEQQAALSAPGSAPILAAQAHVATLQSEAMFHRMLATELRQHATKLAHGNALLKQSADNMKNLRTNMQHALDRH